MGEKTIGAVLDDAAQARPNGVALKDDVREVSFAALRDEARRAAAAFAVAGLNHGDRFAVWAPNSIDWVIAALGGQLRGCVMVPVNTRLKGAEAADIINRTDAKAVFVAGSFLGADYLKMLHAAPIEHECRFVAFDVDGKEGWRAFLEKGGGYDAEALARDIAAVSPSDISDIIFTSGTTGAPKGVMMSHAQTAANAKAWGDAVGLCPGDKYLGVNPFFHTFGYKAGWLSCLAEHAAMLPQPTFDLARVFETIEQEKITVFPGPPTIFEDMLKAPEALRRDTRSLRAAVTGAAVVPVELLYRMRDELHINTVMTAYGLTEASGTATITLPDDDIDLVANCVGKPVDEVEIRIADNEGKSLPAGEHGEVLLKSPFNFIGYLKDEAATKEAYTDDGWLKTGDIGVVDERGYLRITGRKKEMFIVGGFNCYPAEIEFALAKHEAVAEVAVVGAPDSRLGEVGVAFVALAKDAEIAESELVAWARERMANYKVPRRVLFVDSLPRTALGKVMKDELKARLHA